MTDTPHPTPYPFPLDLGVCLPLGALANLFDPKPESPQNCIDRGRVELTVIVAKTADHLSHAKGTGQLAVTFGVPLLQRRLAARIAEARASGAVIPESDPITNSAPEERSAAVADVPTNGTNGASVPAAAHPTEATVSHIAAPDGADAVPAVDLPIPGYDTLSASQIVERLDGLDGDDRAIVQAYEVSHRNRRTVLGKIEQLQMAQ